MVVLALGSNVGDRVDNLKSAVRLLPMSSMQCSYVYESRALLPTGAPACWDVPFLNMVVSGYTSLLPIELLQFVKGIETALGRSNTGFWGPRTIDIDIVLWEGISVQSEILTIPHKEMTNRDFVLVPACDVCPRFPHNILKATLEDILSKRSEINVVKKYDQLPSRQ